LTRYKDEEEEVVERGEVHSPKSYLTTLREYCTPEYTLTAMLAGTYSVLEAVLQGAITVSPKAPAPIRVTLSGMTMLDNGHK
jgi:hypothetical protein